jgi:dipeptidyl aminopeptidase/acylaminoacyl peptidase
VMPCVATWMLVLCTSAMQAQQISNGDIPSVGAAKRPVTVTDAVEMTKIGEDEYLRLWDNSGNVAHFSPDGSKFVFITQKGDLKRDVVAYSIWVFDTATAVKSPKPQLVAKLESSSNRPAVANVKWLPDNNTLAFLGEQPGENPQVYKVTCNSKKLEKLTSQTTPITNFSMSSDGDAFAHLADTEKDPVFSDEERRRGFVVPPRHQWLELYTNRREWDLRHELYVKTATMPVAAKVGVVNGYVFDANLSVSPNGGYALLRAFNTTPPLVWDSYGLKSSSDVTSLPACLEGETAQCPEQYWLVDLQKRTLKPLLDAPILSQDEGNSLALWTKENTVLLINALLPLESARGEERSQRQGHVYAGEMSVPGGQINQFDKRDKILPAYSVEFDNENDRVITKPVTRGYGNPFEIRKQNGNWKITEISDSAAEPKLPLSVTLQENINSAPKLVATDPKTNHSTVLLDLNPQFAQLTFGRVEVFHWKNHDGQPAGGELYYPTDYATGQRYPLVIQTHGESRERFWMDGPFPTANAAQALANKGFFVLQMGFGDRYDKAALDKIVKADSSPQEGPMFASFVESAIDELDHRGLIDRNHIGITGFSRTVYESEYVLTHSNYAFGAAIEADGVDFGYQNCVLYPYFRSICEKMNGGPPWGDAFANWRKESPPMLLDKIHAPILLQSISAPIGEYEIFAGLGWLKKPVEWENFYPEGTHELVQPQQKYFSEQSAVDWYCFWLKNQENSDPAKGAQYKRWRELRKLQEVNVGARSN